MDMDNNKIKVLYISGWGRSGSTILARILGQIDGFFHGGELRTIWVDGLKPNGLCGCGVLVRECSVWKAICDRAFGGIDKIDPPEITRLQRSSEPRTQEALLARFLPNVRSKLKSRLENYHAILDKLYRAIHEVTGSRVIVDDSNHPGYAYTLSMMPGIDLYIVHLIRDPRATAYSWSQRQKKGLGTYTIRDNSLGWNIRNLVTESLSRTVSGKYLRLFYEDFAAKPKLAIQQILNLLEEQPSQLPFVSENEVRLGISHSVFGNPNRTDNGTVTIKLDDEWKKKLDKSDRTTVTTLTFPLLLKYGYFGVMGDR
ncbi:MAG: sulfotransferase [Hydrococcus sp. C42_A2020_068]|nr:sulfotransferase family protein [Pleurocapsa sp. PCC 7327]MBF2019991.1 sulfotransferase [Hydrococcus sp. C42_A2020_068]